MSGYKSRKTGRRGKAYPRKTHKIFLIICEDEKTSPIYFRSFNRRNSPLKIETPPSGGQSPDHLVNYAKKLLKSEYDFLDFEGGDAACLQADCVISMTQAFEGGNVFRVSDVLQVIFGGINILFDDVKTMKTELMDSYIQPADLAQLKIDWERFRKTIGPIEKSLQRRFEAFLDQKRSVFKKRLS